MNVVNMSECTVRTGTPDDVHPMMELAMMACEENGMENPNKVKLLGEIWAALNLDHGIVGIIGEPGKIPEAAILLRVDTLWYSDDQTIVERAIFVHPDYRSAKGGRASKLCTFAKQVQETLGLKLLIGILSSQRTAAKVKLYERQFGPAAGAYWIFGGTTGSVVSQEAS